MTPGESLFERLRLASSREARPLGDDRTRLVRSIARNLERMIESREGHAPAQMDYGIPAPSEVVQLVGDGLETMRTLLRDCVVRYEPRLRDVSVLHVETEDAQQLVFSVRGRLVVDQSAVSFDTFVDHRGRLRLRD